MKKRTPLLGLLVLAAVLGGVALLRDGLGTRSGAEDGDPTRQRAARAPGAASTAAGGARLQGAADAGAARTGGPDAAQTVSDSGTARVDLVRGAWLDAHRSKTSPTTVEGLILLDTEPIRAGRVLAHRVGYEPRTGPLDPEAEDVLVLPVDERGVFHLDPVDAPGASLLQIEIHVPGYEPRLVMAQVWNWTGERRFVRLGAAALAGEIRDPDGRPVSGAQVVVTWAGELENGVRTTTRTASGRDGAYRVEGLASGPYEVSVTYPKVEDAAPETRRRVTFVPAATTAHLDIGGERHDPLLGGTVQTKAGAARGPGRILLASQDGNGETFTVEFDAWGRYRAPVPAGTYLVKIQAPGWSRADAQSVAEPLVVEAVDRVHDFELRGLRLAGEVRDARTGTLVESSRVTWKEKGAHYPAAFHRIAIENGEYVIDGLLAGRTYEVWAGRRGYAPTFSNVVSVAPQPTETARRVDLRQGGP